MLSLVGSALRGAGWLFVIVLAAIGLAATVIKVTEQYGSSLWSREQLDLLAVYGKLAWTEGKNALETITWALAAFGLVVALGRLKTIAKLIADFRESKGSIFELSTTITGVQSSVAAVKGSAAALEAQVSRFSDLAPVVTSTAEKLEDALKQLADLQRIVVSEQGPDAVPDGGATPTVDADRLEENWQKLRSFWFANGERLDAVIERIPNSRVRSRFRRMPKTDYPSIIHALTEEGRISRAACELSLELHKEFLSHRSRKKPVTDSIVGAAQVRDAMLEQELNTIVPSLPAEITPMSEDLRKNAPEPVN